MLQAIGADMVLVANGGLGSAFDELELNRICVSITTPHCRCDYNKVIPGCQRRTKTHKDTDNFLSRQNT
jgi:hypothetical protein